MAEDVLFDGEEDQEQQVQEQGDVDGTSIPVATNSDDQAAWINTTENGQAYLSIKLEDGEYTALFPQSDALQITLNRIHEVQKQQWQHKYAQNAATNAAAKNQ